MTFIRVWIDASPTTGNKEIFRVRLEGEERIGGLYKTLKTAIDIHIAGTGTKQEQGGLWKYQLVSRDFKSVVQKTSVYLKTDDDYKLLVKTVKGDDKKTPVAILTQEKIEDTRSGTNRSSAEKATQDAEGRGKEGKEDEAIWDDSDWKEPLDEDGNRYFDPYDPEAMTRAFIRYAEEHKGPMDEGP